MQSIVGERTIPNLKPDLIEGESIMDDWDIGRLECYMISGESIIPQQKNDISIVKLAIRTCLETAKQTRQDLEEIQDDISSDQSDLLKLVNEDIVFFEAPAERLIESQWIDCNLK
eukprot:UN23369